MALEGKAELNKGLVAYWLTCFVSDIVISSFYDLPVFVVLVLVLVFRNK